MATPPGPPAPRAPRRASVSGSKTDLLDAPRRFSASGGKTDLLDAPRRRPLFSPLNSPALACRLLAQKPQAR